MVPRIQQIVLQRFWRLLVSASSFLRRRSRRAGIVTRGIQTNIVQEFYKGQPRKKDEGDAGARTAGRLDGLPGPGEYQYDPG